MFCYFIQKKGFLDEDLHYLQNKLRACKELEGKDNFYNFYRNFLLNLFHDGLGKPKEKRDDNLQLDMGKIPYLNGGLFDVHELEQQFNNINISDEAFQEIFDFFDQWNWHLDNSFQATGRDINPDVIGYIFEKYINDRASMGAYYTKEDITEYIGKNTILPFLFDETERQYKEAFKPESKLWQFLKDSGDTYIYDAVKHGVPEESGLFDDLPEDVQQGLRPDLENEIVKEETSPHLWEIRKTWNRPAPADIALPTELYREVIDRRKRYAEVKETIENGEITHINDFITYNLNIRQFIQDFIENTEDARFIRHFYQSLQKVTILDPTCGSGAFLFAALNILEPLYEACIERMENFVAEESGKHKFFEEILSEVKSEHHPSFKYFIYKTIILNNLYGVDLMKEAVEIAKLRLFLKLVATVDVNHRKPNLGLEPLPDIDFNIQSGNTLVGFASEKELLREVQMDKHGQTRLGYEKELKYFREECKLVSQAYQRFQDNQLIQDQGSEEFREAKTNLNERLKNLNDKLNEYLAKSYGIEKFEDLGGNTQLFRNENTLQQVTSQYTKWLETHQPLHWFAEFYDIVSEKGGFDLVIGNPPYVVFKQNQVFKGYKEFETFSTSNLYALCSERAFSLMNKYGKFGFILPDSSISADKLMPLQELLIKNKKTWVSNYAWRPSKLFEGANMLLAIIISHKSTQKQLYTTNYLRWNKEFRNYLFKSIFYAKNTNFRKEGSLPKISYSRIRSILVKTQGNKNQITNHIANKETNYLLYYFRAVLYWIKILDRKPVLKEDGKPEVTGEMKSLYFNSDIERYVFISLLSSSLFYINYIVWSSCQVINSRDFQFSFDFSELDEGSKENLYNLGKILQEDLQNNSEIIIRNYSKKGRNYQMEKQYFYLKESKRIINKIDEELAKHYRFTENELDLVINYDIKYRMGQELFEEQNEPEKEENQ